MGATEPEGYAITKRAGSQYSESDFEKLAVVPAVVTSLPAAPPNCNSGEDMKELTPYCVGATAADKWQRLRKGVAVCDVERAHKFVVGLQLCRAKQLGRGPLDVGPYLHSQELTAAIAEAIGGSGDRPLVPELIDTITDDPDRATIFREYLSPAFGEPKRAEHMLSDARVVTGFVCRLAQQHAP